MIETTNDELKRMQTKKRRLRGMAKEGEFK